MKAHRAAYLAFVGPIPEGLLVLHHCDNRACIRIDHLHLGTQLDNVRECIERGRYRRGPTLRGEAAPGARFTEAQITAIREAYASGETQRSIALRYGTVQQSISNICSGRIWAHLPVVARTVRP